MSDNRVLGGSRAAVVASAAVVLLVGVILFLGLRRDVPVAAIPDPDLSAVEPQVASKITALIGDVVQHPRSAAAWGELAMNLDVHNMADDAIRAYKQAYALDSHDVRWPYFCAVTMRSARSSESIEWFERAREISPDYAPLLVRYGQAMEDVGDLDGASKNFVRALKANPKEPHAYLGLARIALARGDMAATETNIVEALKIDPRYGDAYGLLSELYRRNQREADAALASIRARQFLKAVPLVDSIYVQLVREGVSTYWFLRRGKAYTQAGLFDLARREFQRAVAARSDAETHFHLGLALQYGGQADSAVAEFQVALAERPDYPIALRHLGTMLFAMNRREEALHDLERARQLDPAVPDAYLTLGGFYEKMGNHAKAIARYRDGLSNAPYDYRIATRLAMLLATATPATLRNADEAVRLAEAARRVIPGGDPETLDVLAVAYAANGEFSKALATARQAYRIAELAGMTSLAGRIQSRIKRYETGMGR
ncbi:MAG: tetratricopeptide repeat protein [Gemmatimonadales bacterium]